MVKLCQKCPFKDFGCCPKILDYTLYPQSKNTLPSLLKVRKTTGKMPPSPTLRFTSVKVLDKVQQKLTNIKPLKLGQYTELTAKKWLQYMKV